MLEDETSSEIDPVEFRAAALATFNEMVDGGCSLQDAITAVYMAGMDQVIGNQLKKRSKTPSTPPCPYKDIVGLYHEVLPELPGVDLSLLSAQRKAALRKFWVWVLTSKRDNVRRAQNTEQGLVWLRAYFTRVRSSDFMMGLGSRTGEHRNWKADLDYLATERGMRRVIEKTDSQ